MDLAAQPRVVLAQQVLAESEEKDRQLVFAALYASLDIILGEGWKVVSDIANSRLE